MQSLKNIVGSADLKTLNILVACEESQAVANSFRELGHRAFSCDIQECSGGHPEWHIVGDVLPLLDGHCNFKTQDEKCHKVNDKWDLIIAFPPCTHLAVSGAPHFTEKRKDGRQLQGVWFFCQFFMADCDHVCVENPVNIMSGDYVRGYYRYHAQKYGFPASPTQKIHPWMFGDNFAKTTCLWLNGLPKLEQYVYEQPELEWKEWTDGKTGRKKRQAKWYYDALANSKTKEERSKVRSKTFPGVAKAMAQQWSEYLTSDHEKPSEEKQMDIFDYLGEA